MLGETAANTPDLFFWRDVPVDVEKDVFEYVSRNWGGKVTVISQRDHPRERAQLGWLPPQLDQRIVERSPRQQLDTGSLLASNSSIHIFNGFRGETRQYLERGLKEPGFRWGVLAERPTVFADSPLGRTKQLASNLLYRSYSRRFSNDVAVFFAMGVKGKKVYQNLGFRPDVIYTFMYGFYDSELDSLNTATAHKEITRLVYVGRLDRQHKGLDMLLQAVREIDRSDFTLDIVGGYGDMLSAVQRAAAADPRVNYLGPWAPHQVVRNLSHYDVCVIPSRYDGWNVITNQAINAGLACIVSEGATSDELVTASGSGLVIPRNDQQALNGAIETVLDTPELVDGFKRAAREYRHRIAPASVGQFMIDALRFSFDLPGVVSRPACPWLENGRGEQR